MLHNKKTKSFFVISNYINSKSLFLPTNISNIVAWFDPSFLDTVVTHGHTHVSELLNKTNNNNLTATGSHQPSTGINSLNGLNVLDYAGDWFVLPSNIYLLPEGDYSMYILAKQDGSGGSRLVNFQTSGTVAGLQYLTTSDQVKFISGNSTGVTATGVTKTNWNLFSCRRSGTSLTLQVNGGADFESSEGVNTTPTSGNIATFLNGIAGNFNGNISAMIFYNKILSDSESDKIEGYIMHRFGLKGYLPSDHAYKNLIP